MANAPMSWDHMEADVSCVRVKVTSVSHWVTLGSNMESRWDVTDKQNDPEHMGGHISFLFKLDVLIVSILILWEEKHAACCRYVPRAEHQSYNWKYRRGDGVNLTNIDLAVI